MVKLDAIDWRILKVMQSEGRISNLDLAERVGLSPTPCGRRLRRLEETGVITGYAARIDPVMLGLGISVIVTVRLTRQGSDDVSGFLEAVKRQPEITECLLVTGSLDYVLRLRVRDVASLRDFILGKLKSIPCIAETSTMIILQSEKDTELMAVTEFD